MRGSGLDTSCIKPPDVNQRTFALQMCGNGIVEAGEQCDPGAGSNSTCCDSATCRFTENSVCDPLSSSCCTSSCQFAPAAQVCRPARDPTCDIAESCTGLSADCPADQTSPNGKCGGPLVLLFLIVFSQVNPVVLVGSHVRWASAHLFRVSSVGNSRNNCRRIIQNNAKLWAHR
jgi:hypothetical protein